MDNSNIVDKDIVLKVYSEVLAITSEVNKKIVKDSDKEVSERIVNAINAILEDN